MKMLLGVTGSVAATLTPKLVTELLKRGHEVQIIATEPALYFFNPFIPNVKLWRDAEEWKYARYVPHSPIPHIDLRSWADAMIIAPISANTLGKLAHGIADNLLTCTMRAWDFAKPIILVPAMNTHMWVHPATAEHLKTLRRWYPKLTIIPPVEKTLACGDVGIGAMAEIETIVATLPQVAKT